jgi:hypothetical protein
MSDAPLRLRSYLPLFGQKNDQARCFLSAQGAIIRIDGILRSDQRGNRSSTVAPVALADFF